MSAAHETPEDVVTAAAEPGAPPRDAIEVALCDVWRRLLGRPDVGVHDDFFDLGGHSLLAIRMVVEVRRVFGIDLTAADLLEGGTVAKLASVVRRGVSAQPSGPLVRLQQGVEGRAPLYAFPPVSGTILLYGSVAKEVGRDQPMWGLQSVGLLPGEEPLGSVEEIAAHFLEHMRRVHPGGPWHLVGYSMGGIIAYEVARQLLAAGDEVGLVGLFDTRTVVELSDDPDFALRALLWRGLRIELDIDALRALAPDDRADLLLRTAIEAGTIPPDFDGDRLRRMIDMYQHNLEALAAYQRPHFAGEVTLFRVTDRSLEHGETEDLGWGEVADRVVIDPVPGTHYTMIEPPHVAVLAQRILAHIGVGER